MDNHTAVDVSKVRIVEYNYKISLESMNNKSLLVITNIIVMSSLLCTLRLFYLGLYAVYCESCGEMIELNDGHMVHNDMHWHANDNCFSCSECSQSLLGKTFLPKHGKLYCSVACFKIGRMPNEYGGSEESLVEYSDAASDINQIHAATNNLKDTDIKDQSNLIHYSDEHRIKSVQTNKKYWNRNEDYTESNEIIPELSLATSSGVHSQSQKSNWYKHRDNNAELSRNSTDSRHSRFRTTGQESIQSSNQINADAVSYDYHIYGNSTKNPQHRKSLKQRTYNRNDLPVQESPSSDLKSRRFSPIDRVPGGLVSIQSPDNKARDVDQGAVVMKGYRKSETITGSSSDDSQPDNNVTFNLNGKLDPQRAKQQYKGNVVDSYNESRKEKKVRIVDEAVDKSKCTVM